MTVFIRSESWAWLSQMGNAEDADLFRQLKTFLIKDFQQAFELLRTQKLLSRSRSLETTARLCEDLETWAKTALLSGKERSRLIRHCKVTVGLQSMMYSVVNATAVLDIWNLSFPDLSAILISTLEATNVAFNQSMVEQLASSRQADFLALNSKKNWFFRGSLDGAQLVINEARRRCALTSDFQTGNPSAFVQALQLAQETTEIMLAWDHYSFGRLPLNVVGSEIKVQKQDARASVQSANYQQRMMELDVTNRSSAHQRFSMLSEDIKPKLSPEAFSVPLDDFIKSPSGLDALTRLLPTTKGLEKDISDRLEALIDLNQEVKIGRLRHVYRDLIAIWCYIVRIAITSRIWGELVHSATGEYPVAIISISALRETFVGLHELSQEAIDKGISHFSSFKDQKQGVDLFHHPLLRLSEESVLVPAGYVLNSRFERNLLSIIAREKNDSVAAKGRKPLRRIRTLFEKAGFRCLEDVDIRGNDRRVLTDLDLVAYRDNDAFFFQSKVLSIPDTPYEYWRVDQTLLSAAVQMDTVMDNKVQVEAAIQKNDPNFSLRKANITAYLITDVMVHSGFQLGGYEVVDFDHLEHVLRGAHLGVFDLLKQEVIATFSEIDGDSPSADEIRQLISALKTPKGRPTKATTDHSIERGGWVLRMEATKFV